MTEALLGIDVGSSSVKVCAYNRAGKLLGRASRALHMSHQRQLSRRLSRNLAYEYTWENSNFHDQGANEKHLVTYSFSYAF